MRLKKQAWHVLSKVDSEKSLAVCSQCGPVDITPKSRNSDGTVRQYCCGNKNREQYFKAATRTPDLIQQLASQHGLCLICKDPISLDWRAPNPAQRDHCHQTGSKRGLLCRGCNTGLGSFRDKPELLKAAIVYLQNFRVH